MNRSDSISAFGGPGFEIFFLGEGDAGISGGAKLPQDVIDALNEDDLELAVFLLDRHREEEGPELSSSNSRRSSKIQRFFSRIQMPMRRKAVPKKSSRGRSSKTQNTRARPQIVVVVKMVGAKAGKVAAQTAQVPVKMAKAAVAITKKGMRAVVKFMEKTVYKPAVRIAVKPAVQIAEKIVERGKIIQKFIGVCYQKVAEKGHELQEKLVYIAEKVVQEAKELAHPVKLWLENKFDKYIKTQTWVNSVIGKEMTKIGEQSIQVVAYALVPVTFTIKHIKKGYQKAIGKIRKSADGAFSKAKRWINGKLAKGLMLFNQTFQTFKSAIERLALQWLMWLLSILKALTQLAIKVAKSSARLLKAGAQKLKRICFRLAQRAFQGFQR